MFLWLLKEHCWLEESATTPVAVRSHCQWFQSTCHSQGSSRQSPPLPRSQLQWQWRRQERTVLHQLSHPHCLPVAEWRWEEPHKPRTTPFPYGVTQVSLARLWYSFSCVLTLILTENLEEVLQVGDALWYSSGIPGSSPIW